ncbi:MAG: UDP-N-acetylmuramoyl-tripeptide--D-alanyl-D-alanine ligase [Candidatus Yanofskybacteria bacterium]|nr:UDP-N-acetylmuramoyl-tripeptide--D-alanyl-D-alanine ligase [Candidatus Yanofskybacteria bacterium]
MEQFFLGSLLVFWLIRAAKASLFWLSLWQVKSYQVGRFLDHFRTAQGKKLLLYPLLGVKVIGLSLFFAFDSPFIPLLFLFLVYGAEAGKTVLDVMGRRIRVPVLTSKSIPLIGIALGLVFLVLFATRDPRVLVLYDIFIPLVVFLIVSALQPFNLIARELLILRPARKRRAQFPNLITIGITGSYGKTTTKEILSHILSAKYAVLKTPEHLNSEVGIARTILKDLKREHQVFVCEMGAYKKGEIAMFSKISQPTMGIVTGVNEQHLATFGSMKNLLSGEGGKELVSSLPNGGVLVVNGNNAYARDLEAPKLKKKTAGFSRAYDVWAEGVQQQKTSISFLAHSRDGDSAAFTVNLLGGHNVENILVSASLAKELGMSMREIAERCKSIVPELGALKLRKSREGMNVVDSTYSANPDGVRASLEYLAVWPGKKAIVLPSLIELGEASADVHQNIGEKIGEVCSLAIVTTADHFNELKAGAIKAGMTEKSVIMSANPQAILERLKSLRGPEDIILLEGGKESATQTELKRLLFS